MQPATSSVVQHLSPWLGLLAGLVITVVFASALGLLTLNLSGHFLPLGTIAWGIALYFVFGNTDAVGKYDGLVGLPPISLAGFPLDRGRGFYCFLWLVVLLAALAMQQAAGLPAGPRPARAKGRHRHARGHGHQDLSLQAGRISACGGSGLHRRLVAGALPAHGGPSVSSMQASINYLFMAVIGGVTYIGGAVGGAALTQILDDRLQVWLPHFIGGAGHYEGIVFGFLLVLMLQRANRGMFGVFDRWASRSRREVTPQALPRSPRAVSTEPLLRVRGLSKRFGGLLAVDGIDFDVGAGEIVGLIGPNGAGKSTTFNLISGVLPPSGGTVTFDGQDISGGRHAPSRALAWGGRFSTFAWSPR
jgi:branched-chain amino acid transport system permease protein